METWDAPDPTSEPSSEDTPAPAESSPFESSQAASSPSPQTDTSSEGSSDPTPETSSSESSTSSDSSPASESEGGILTGTASEQAPGVGGTGDHPAPAVVVDPETGGLHVAGEPPAGTIAGTQAPVGDSADEQSGDVSPEAKERLNAVHEPEQVETDRPDIGTE